MGTRSCLLFCDEDGTHLDDHPEKAEGAEGSGDTVVTQTQAPYFTDEETET